MPPGARAFPRLIDKLNDAHYLAGNGVLIMNGGEAAIYFVWGQPAHACCRVGEQELTGAAALEAILARITKDPKVEWHDAVPDMESLSCSTQDLIAMFDGSGRYAA